MRIVLFIIAGLLAISWILGFFIFSAGTIIHILVISAALAFLHAIIHTPKPQPDR